MLTAHSLHMQHRHATLQPDVRMCGWTKRGDDGQHLSLLSLIYPQRMMLVLLERRNLVVTLLSSSFGYQTPPGSDCLSFADSLHVIQRTCPAAFQRAVRQSGKCLYRGESVSCPTILNPPSDLLDPVTYDNDPAALAFFACLEGAQHDQNRAVLLPSNGHIGTARRDDAAQWGAPCTIWPLGQPFDYMWPTGTASGLFYPGSVCNESSALSSNFSVGTGLATALRLEKEVMFTSPAFLVLPQAYEKNVKDAMI